MNFLYRIYAAFPGRDNMTAFSKCSSTNTVNLVLDIFMSEKSDTRHLMSKKSGTRHCKSGARHLMSEVILELLSTSTNSLRDCILNKLTIRNRTKLSNIFSGQVQTPVNEVNLGDGYLEQPIVLYS